MLFAAFSFFLDSWQHNKKEAYQSSAQEIEIVVEDEKVKAMIPQRGIVDSEVDKLIRRAERGKSFISQGIKVQFPIGTSNETIEKTLKRDFPHIKNMDWIVWDHLDNKNIAKVYNQKGARIFNSIVYIMDFSYLLIFFLIFAYPLYLIIRFIVWAIVTLTEKT